MTIFLKIRMNLPYLNFLLIGLLITSLYSCALEQASPSDYNDAFFREQMKIKELINGLAKTNDVQRQQEIVTSLQNQAEESYNKIIEIGAFRGDEQLYNAAKVLFESYKRMAEEGLDTDPENISSRLDQWRKQMADEEHVFFRAQAEFAENYELYL